MSKSKSRRGEAWVAGGLSKPRNKLAQSRERKGEEAQQER